MKSIVTNFLRKVLLSVIFIGSLGAQAQSALAQFSKALVPVEKTKTEKSKLIEQLENFRPEIAALLKQKDEQLKLEKEVLKIPRSLSGMWRSAKSHVSSSAKSVLSKARSLKQGTLDALTVGLISSTCAMSAAILSHQAFIAPSWLREINLSAWSAAYYGFIYGVLATGGYCLWQHTSSAKFGAVNGILLDVCEEVGIPVEGLALKSGDGRNKICSRIYDSYNESDNSDTRRGLIKVLLLDAGADKDVVSNAFTKYRVQIDEALKKLKDVVTIKELRDKTFKLAAVLLGIKARLIKINTDLNAVK